MRKVPMNWLWFEISVRLPLLIRQRRLRRPVRPCRLNNSLSITVTPPTKTALPFYVGLFLCALTFLPLLSAAQVKKEDVLKKYEQVIVRSNQMVIYGYDLRDVTFKLRRATNALVAAQYEQADAMLDEIKNDLRVVGARGPEQFRQEKKLAWIEAFGDFIQQFAIFVVLSLILLRLRLVKSSLAKLRRDFHTVWKLTLLFAAVSILGAAVGLIRYGQSSWAFVDLQAVLVGVGGLA